ncbi:MAG: thioredoxin family protein, partial [Gammaproteobacteria bacterium]
FDRLAPGASWRKLWKGLGIILMVYGIAMILGAAAGGGDKFNPLGNIVKTGSDVHTLAFTRIKSGHDLDQVLSRAARAQQAVMLDFYADWCVTCKEMEANTFSNPAVQEVLQNVVLVQADVTANDEVDQALLTRFEIFGPPAILFFVDRQERRHLRVIGYMQPGDFIRHVKEITEF